MSEPQTTATVVHPAEPEHSEPTFLGLNPGGWVALAMLAVFGIFIWKNVHGAIARALDDKIDLIRGQLEEAETLRKDAELNKQRLLDSARTLFAEHGVDVTLNDIAHHAGVGVGTAYRRFPNKEAEALKAEYQAKAKSADKDRKALIERAKHEAEEIVAKAKTDAEALIERRTRMAEEKIAAEERAAVDQLRSAAADAATRAARRLITERHDDAADERLVNQAIGEIARR